MLRGVNIEPHTGNAIGGLASIAISFHHTIPNLQEEHLWLHMRKKVWFSWLVIGRLFSTSNTCPPS